MVKYLVILLSLPSFALSAIELSQKSAAERMLSHGSIAKETNLNAELTRFNLTQALSAYDWSLNLESGWERSRFEAITGLHNEQDDTYKTTLTASKPFTTGTILGIDYTHVDYRSIYRTASTLPNGQTQNIFGVTLQQNLLKNYFGYSDRLSVQAARSKEEANLLIRADNLQNVVLQAIGLFWKTYVAQQSFQDAIGSEERYQKLANTVERKNKLGYAAPGELAQVQAELESRKQAVKIASAHYLNLADQLLTFLNYPSQSEIKFIVDKEIPPPPVIEATNIESLRSIRSIHLQKEAAEKEALAEEKKNWVDLSLVGKYYVAGLDAATNDSWSEMVGGNFPKYYIGLKLSHSFGSGHKPEIAHNKKIQSMIQSTQLERKTLEKKDQIELAQRKLITSHQTVVSAKTQKEWRNKAMLELQQAYNQGRTDITNLVTAMNFYFSSEVTYSTAVGDYQIALNEWSALRDQLIKEKGEKP